MNNKEKKQGSKKVYRTLSPATKNNTKKQTEKNPPINKKESLSTKKQTSAKSIKTRSIAKPNTKSLTQTKKQSSLRNSKKGFNDKEYKPLDSKTSISNLFKKETYVNFLKKENFSIPFKKDVVTKSGYQQLDSNEETKKKKKTILLALLLFGGVATLVTGITVPLVLANAALANANMASMFEASAAYLDSYAMLNIKGDKLTSKNKISIKDNDNIINIQNVEYITVENNRMTVTFTYDDLSALKNPILMLSNCHNEKSLNFHKGVNQVQTDSFSNLTTYKKQDLATTTRIVNKEFYEPQLAQDYGKYGFQYPGWDNNYNTEANRILTLPNGSSINMREKVFNERVTGHDGSIYKYSDAAFITQEIANRTFKKHPAANNFFERKVNDQEKAVTREFEIGTTIGGVNKLGLYAPAGEIITLQLDDDTFNLIQQNLHWGDSSFSVAINDGYWDNYAEPNTGAISNRYPFLRSQFNINKEQKTISFGSPFGGSISVYVNSQLLDKESSSKTLKFTVSGAIPQLFFIDNQTTLSKWNSMIEKVKNNELSAPEIAFHTDFAGFTLPFTSQNEIGYIDVNEVVYPQPVMTKYYQFHYLSNYFANRDGNQNGRRRVFRFNNDIWGGAGAWGGGDMIACPISWGSDGFLRGVDAFSANGAWGLLHEINHGFQQNGAFFVKNTHGETNQVTTAALSLLNDKTRFRNLRNANGEGEVDWSILTTDFANIQFVLNTGSAQGEYTIYAALLYLMGPKNFYDYVRQDIKEHSSVGGLEEIIRISNFLGYNMWPAFQKYTKYWHDNWPASYEVATAEQKKMIDSISHLPEADFTGNVYAAGSYKYDYKNNSYQYLGDVNPAYEIPAGSEYTFDFGKAINTLNENLGWDNLTFNATSDLGASLKIDPTNPKRLIYKPLTDATNQALTDSFDVSIRPKFATPNSNYVPTYKWKVKVRQVVEGMKATSEILSEEDASKTISENVAYLENLNSSYVSSSNLSVNSVPYGNSITKYEFDFVADADGEYSFYGKWDDQIIVLKDGVQIFENNYYNQNSFNQLGSGNYLLRKNETTRLTVYVKNTGGPGSFDLRYKINNSELQDASKNITPPDTRKLQVNEDLISFIRNQKFAYKPRELNFEMFSEMTAYSLNHTFNIQAIDPDTFTFSNHNGPNWIDVLKNKQEGYWELWNKSGPGGSTYGTFDVNFSQVEELNSVSIGWRTTNHAEARADKVKITVYDENNNPTVAFEENVSRWKDVQTYNFKETYLVKKVKIEAFDSTGYGLAFKYAGFNKKREVYDKELISVANQVFKFKGMWAHVKNDPILNYSPVNGIALYNSQRNQELSFELEAKGFIVSGQKGPNTSTFDVYVNDQLVASNVNTWNGKQMFDEKIFEYIALSRQKLNVRIVNKENKPLWINYLIIGKN